MLRSHDRSTTCIYRGHIALAAVLATLAAAPALASAAETNLGKIGFGAITVDNAREHVLVSGPTANVVDVLSLSGTLITTIPQVYGAEGIAIHGSTAYVVESTTGEIAAINLKKLKLQPKPVASGLVRPKWIAITGEDIWATSSLSSSRSVLVSINLKTHESKQFTEAFSNPDLATSPADENALFLAVDGDSPGSVYRFNTSSGTPVLAASNTFTNQENIEDLAVSPDGTRVIPASGWPYDFEELSASTLEPDGVIYPGEAYPSAVAVSGRKANYVATGISSASHSDVIVDVIGKPEPIFEATTHSSSYFQSVLAHGLALSKDGRALFAVSSTGSERNETLLNAYELP